MDGIFGILTEEAVKEFQRKNDLVVDELLGKKHGVNFLIHPIYKSLNRLFC